jgi:hypothetical protein
VLRGTIVGFSVKYLGCKEIVNKKLYKLLQFEGMITENNGSIQREI